MGSEESEKGVRTILSPSQNERRATNWEEKSGEITNIVDLNLKSYIEY